MPEKVLYKNQAEKQSEKERQKYLNRASKEVIRAETCSISILAIKCLVQC